MRVLIIDDEKNIADTLALILREAGYASEPAYDGDSALVKIESFPPDCVISDVIMPRMNGLQVCTAIQEKYPNCQVLLFSGQAESNHIVDEARVKGCTWELLAKPVEPEDLLAKLASLAGSLGRAKAKVG